MKKTKRKVPRLTVSQRMKRLSAGRNPMMYLIVSKRASLKSSRITATWTSSSGCDFPGQYRTTQYALASGDEGCAEQTCPPAHNGRHDACSHMARGTAGTRTKSKLKLRRLKRRFSLTYSDRGLRPE